MRIQASERKVRRVALIVEANVAPRRQMLTGVAQYIQEHEPWALYLKPASVQKNLNDWLSSWEGDGIIASVHEPLNDAVLQKHLPLVDCAGGGRAAGAPYVHANDLAIGRLGAEHLIDRGFRHFGFCQYPGEDWSTDRRKGFIEALRLRGFKCQVYDMSPPAKAGGPEGWEQQQRAAVEWILSLPKPAGIMTSTDMMGQHILEACMRAEVKVPEELAVVGADNDELVCRVCSPPLSSVMINDHQRGYQAAAMLDRLMNGLAVPSGPIYIEPTGVACRASSDVLAIEDGAVVSALRYIRTNASEGINVRDVVTHVPVSRSVLERRFRRMVGRSINEEIIRLRLNKAIELLTCTSLELKAIARKAGFGSQAYMTAVFRAKLDCTPGSYRIQTEKHAEPRQMAVSAAG